jgi:hypothetical protein
VLPLRRAEELIATLPGVLSVRIVAGDSGAVDEVHVLTTSEVVPKHMVRNIESALMAQLGLRVNHRKVSIAQSLDPVRAADAPPAGAVRSAVGAMAAPSTGGISGGIPGVASPYYPASTAHRTPLTAVQGASTAAPAGGETDMAGAATVATRLADTQASGRRVMIFEDVEVRRSRSRGVLCKVTLSRGDVEFIGEAEGQETERSRLELSARATILALLESVKVLVGGGDRSLALEGAKLIDAFDREFVFVSVLARVGRASVVLTGSCEVRESAETSAALAVLDATNRWMQLDQ